MRLVRFLYDGENGGSGGAFDMTTLPSDIQEKLQKYDELAQFKEQTLTSTQKTPEQLQKEADLEEANFRTYSIESGLLKNTDFSAHESLKAKNDSDLVYEDFEKSFKEDHPDIEEDELSTQARQAFENQYHLNSTDKTLKTRGEKLLKKEAAELRNPVESLYTKARESYDDRKSIAAKHPEYVKFFADVSKETLPEKITLYKTKEGEDEISIEVDITEEDKKAVEEKFFKNVKNFSKFISAKPEEFKVELAAKINSFIRQRKMEEGFGKAWEKARDIGTAKGSDVGAGQPFSIVKGMGGSDVVIEANAKKEAIDSTRRRTGS